MYVMGLREIYVMYTSRSKLILAEIFVIEGLKFLYVMGLGKVPFRYTKGFK